MIRLELPAGRAAERRYAAEFVLGTLLGQPFTLATHAGAAAVITLPGRPGRLVVADRFLATGAEHWLTPASLPSTPLPAWKVDAELGDVRLAAPDLPVLFGAGPPWWRRDGDDADLGLDVFGSAFFMLSRYEEVVAPARDEHERFPARASLALREGFLERPLLDEYAEVLWACMTRLWPGLERPRRRGGLRLSHDVDWPLSPAMSPSAVLRRAAGDAIVRRSPRTAARRLRAWAERRRGRFDNDLNNTFDELMERSERQGVRSAFYFITDNTAGAIDGDYSLDDPWLRALLRRIHERGHEIGLHPSYGTFRDPAQLRREFERLLAVTGSLGIDQPEWGGRQHYLRWEAPTSWRAWAEAGLAYDASVGYADHVGFRSGTCHDHPVFDLARGAALPLLERPLVAMEGTLLDDRYMALGLEEAVERAVALARVCASFGGHFNFLWHNSSFPTPRHHRAYASIVSEAHAAFAA